MPQWPSLAKDSQTGHKLILMKITHIRFECRCNNKRYILKHDSRYKHCVKMRKRDQCTCNSILNQRFPALSSARPTFTDVVLLRYISKEKRLGKN